VARSLIPLLGSPRVTPEWRMTRGLDRECWTSARHAPSGSNNLAGRLNARRFNPSKDLDATLKIGASHHTTAGFSRGR